MGNPTHLRLSHPFTTLDSFGMIEDALYRCYGDNYFTNINMCPIQIAVLYSRIATKRHSASYVLSTFVDCDVEFEVWVFEIFMVDRHRIPDMNYID